MILNALWGEGEEEVFFELEEQGSVSCFEEQ